MNRAKSFNGSAFGRWINSPAGRAFRLVAGSGFALAGVLYLGHTGWKGIADLEPAPTVCGRTRPLLDKRISGWVAPRRRVPGGCSLTHDLTRQPRGSRIAPT